MVTFDATKFKQEYEHQGVLMHLKMLLMHSAI